MARRAIAITCGDPAGIGPEIVAKALASGRLGRRTEWIAVGPKGSLEPLASRLRLKDLALEPCGEAAAAPSAKSGAAALAAIDRAAELVQSGRCGALVTAPVSKAWIAKTAPFRGHTEYLASKAGVRETTMAFFSDSLNVALVTTHLPLKKVAGRLTRERIVGTVRRTAEALKKYFGKGRPRIAVASLNPHAGEDGLFGREEEEIIAPAVADARREGLLCEGPFAADSVFRRPGYDAFVSMYHDNGLAVVKTLAPNASNVTLGLPYVRTSPDHGTAFDIAGKMVADPEPMIHALLLADRMLGAELL